MEKINNKLWIVVLIFLICIPLINGAKPSNVINTNTAGLDISYPESYYIKVNNNLSVRFWVYNLSSGTIFTNTSINCTYNIIDSDGKNIIRISSPNISFGINNPNACQNCFNINIGGGNFSTKKYLSYQIRCQGQGLGGYRIGDYEVTTTGFDAPSDNLKIFFIILFLIITATSLYLVLYSFGHFLTLDFTLGDLAMDWGAYIFIVGYYAFENYYWNISIIESFYLIYLYVSGILLVLVPIIALIFSTIIGTLNKKKFDIIGKPRRRIIQ